MADAHTMRWRRARKSHRCCECDLAIESGERYAEHSGIYEGRPYRYRRCLSCNAWADVAHELLHACGGYDDEGPRFGGVAEWLAEWANELGCIYVPLNLAARLPVNRLAWADYVPWGCWDGWSSRPASAACRPDVLAAHRTPLMWRCVVADHQTLGRDARNALRRAVVLWPSTDVPGGARAALVAALDHAERGRWRAALAETSRAVSLARNLAERAALRRAISDALVSMRAICGALDDSREGHGESRRGRTRDALRAELAASSWRFDASGGAALFVSAWTDGVVDLAIKPPSGARDTATVGMTAAVAAELARAFRILARAPCRHGAELAPGRLKFDAPHLVVTEPDKGRSAQAKLTPTLLRRIAKALEAAANTARPNTTEEASNA